MKRLLSFLAVFTGIAAIGYVSGNATGQTAKPKAANVLPGVGVIDVEHVFKNYQRFTRQQEGFQAELERKQTELSEVAKQIKDLEEARKQYKSESPEYQRADEEITALRADLAVKAQKADKDFASRENTMVRNAYEDIKDAIRLAAEQYKLSLVLQLRATDPSNSSSRVEIAKELNREVLYFHEEMDITQPVLKYLNNRFENEVGVKNQPRRGAVQPAKKTN